MFEAGLSMGLGFGISKRHGGQLVSYDVGLSCLLLRFVESDEMEDTLMGFLLQAAQAANDNDFHCELKSLKELQGKQV